MKKKLFSFVIVFVTVILCMSFFGCSPQAGKSAYEIACEHGFTGTEQEWLESLVGTDGADGKNGINGANGNSIDIYDLYDAYVENVDPNADFEEFLNSYLSVDFNDSVSSAAKAISSVVSVYCSFGSSISTAGSGVIYRITQNDVYIITNYHVVYYNSIHGIASSIELYTYGLEFSEYTVPAEFIGGSITKDIAVLKASHNDFFSYISAASIGDSNTLALGERTVAVGNPSAEGISITSGVVSVTSETITMSALSGTGSVSMRVIRTDTAINSGNSGGGLFNMKGQLIGIVNAKSIETDIENIGFAIPATVAVGIADCVIENNAKKCQLGITVSTQSISTSYDPVSAQPLINETMLVEQVALDALADGKILVGDKLISVTIANGESMELERSFHLSDFLYKVRVGDTIHLTVERDTQLITITLTPTAANFVDV